MVSILIPVYNYNIKPLVSALLLQVKELDTICEIIVCDDNSSQDHTLNNNKFFCKENNISFLQNKENIGRTQTRQLLAQQANYNWLLFLDADVLPKCGSFLQQYFLKAKKEYDCVYGGICYESKKPKREYILRWKFGTYREDISLNKRISNPYKSIASGNLLIKKTVFLDINSLLNYNWYGYDNFFSAQLKENHKTIKHISNQVYHLGLEDNITFLQKKEAAANTIYQLYKKGLFTKNHDNGLLKSYERLNTIGVLPLFLFFFKCCKNLIKKNLLGKNPNLFLLNIYRLGYFCSLKTQNNA